MRCHCWNFISLYYRDKISLATLSNYVGLCREREIQRGAFADPLGHTYAFPEGIPELDAPRYDDYFDTVVIKSSAATHEHGWFAEHDKHIV